MPTGSPPFPWLTPRPVSAEVPEAVRQDFLARRLDPLEKGLTPQILRLRWSKSWLPKARGPAVRERLIASMSALRTEAYKQACTPL